MSRKNHYEPHPSDGRPPYNPFELKRASLLHLLDLKKAGCSPRRTELRIDRRDRRVGKSGCDV